MWALLNALPARGISCDPRPSLQMGRHRCDIVHMQAWDKFPCSFKYPASCKFWPLQYDRLSVWREMIHTATTVSQHIWSLAWTSYEYTCMGSLSWSMFIPADRWEIFPKRTQNGCWNNKCPCFKKRHWTYLISEVLLCYVLLRGVLQISVKCEYIPLKIRSEIHSKWMIQVVLCASNHVSPFLKPSI